MSRPRVYILGNPRKANVEATIDSIVACARQHADVVGTTLKEDYADVRARRPDRLIVVGGDGTILAAARELHDTAIAVIGVNRGKMGYLAEFSLEDLTPVFAQVMTDESLIVPRMMLDVEFDEPAACATVLNDCVIHAGPPYRMINLLIEIEGQHLTVVRGDGLIISTPSGSTAHNMAAGGPILQPGIDAWVVTPLCPHSLTHQPLVVECKSELLVRLVEANEGTVASLDGQRMVPMHSGRTIRVRRSPHDFRLVRNPLYPPWHTLVTKLKWGR